MMTGASHRRDGSGQWRRIPATVALAAGVFLGLGAFTFRYAEGLSYLSADPAACANCHIMRPQFDSWQKSSHHAVAVCVDCHLPQDFVGKYLAKAGNGYHHSKGFTFQDFHEPIAIKEGNARILQANCVACHRDLAHDMLAGVAGAPADVECVHCHRTVGHGESAGLGGPGRAAESMRQEP